ncbi:MAG: GH25 family lysozyme [Eubacteriales bacterium]|nr:GH25 family lysozyme [Eubacteriales bacterium]
MKKRLFSLLLAATITVGFLPINSLADELGEEIVITDTETTDDAAVSEGTTVQADDPTEETQAEESLSLDDVTMVDDPVLQDPERYRALYPEADHAAETGAVSIASASYKSFLTGKTYTVPSTKNITNGIDVSKWNKTINWSKVKAAGIDFAIIRVAYRGIGNGKLYTDEIDSGDENYKKNIQGALAAGIPVGVYVYSQAITKAEAREEARYCIERIQGMNITLPIVMDVEYYDNHSGRLADADLSKTEQTDICLAFAEECKAAGYSSMIYANRSMFESQMNVSQVESKSKIWLANYTTATSYSRTYDYWQYSSTGVVDGISTVVDCNFGFTGVSSSTPKITLSKTSLSMAFQNTVTLKATTSNVSGSVTWSSSRSSVATVSSSGKITPKKVGTTVITAKAGSVSATCKVTVRPGKTGIQTISFQKSGPKVKLTWNKKSEADHYRIYRATSKSGTYKYLGKSTGSSYTDSTVKTNKTYYYKICAAGYQGSTLIRSTESAVKSISTSISVTKLTLSKSSLKFVYSKSRTLKATVAPSTASASVSWSTSNKKVATVSGGKVTAKGIGTATIQASAGGKTASCRVTVVPGRVKLTAAKRLSGKRIKLTWKKVGSANYYRIYRATSKNGTYKLIGHTTAQTYTDIGLTAGKRYYYKIRAGKTVDGTKYHGSYSNRRSAKAKA